MGDTLREIARLMARNARVIIVAVAAVVVLWMLEELGEGELMRIDAAAQALFVDTLRADWLTSFMQGITNLATPFTLVCVWLVASAFAPGKRPGLAMGINLGAAFALNQILKFIVQRPRPEGIGLVAAGGYSFPSGHSMVAMAFFGFLIYLIWHAEESKLERRLYCAALGMLIVLIGISRIYLGVHYASDVVAGLLISLAWLAVYTEVFCPTLLREQPDA